MDKNKKEICTIRIIFPVSSDEQAISYKKGIEEILVAEPDAQIHFTLMPPPIKMPTG